MASTDIKELTTKINKIQIDLTEVKIGLKNHLKHHMSYERWIQWGLTTLMALLLYLK